MREFRTAVEATGVKAPDGRKLERVTMACEIKSLDDEGRGAGYLSFYGNEDSYGDVVDMGAFAKTCQERSADNPLPFLWQHYSDEPIGVYTRLDPHDEKGLYTEFRYALGVQRAREAYELARMKACKGQSIGFTTLKDSTDSKGLRHLHELRLWEGSQVTFPANDLCSITGVKQGMTEHHELLEVLRELRAALAKEEPAPTPEVSDPSVAELRSLLDEFKAALGAATPPEPGMPTQEEQKAIADLRAEMERQLSLR